MNASHKKVLAGLSVAAVVFSSIVAAAMLGADKATAMRKGAVLFSANEAFATPEMAANLNAAGAELNLTWGELEPEEGVYNWEAIDTYVNTYKKEGRHLTLRTSTAYFQPDDSPRWLFNQYGVRRVTAEGLFTSFEQETSDFVLGSGAVLSDLVRNAPTKADGRYVWGTGTLVSTGFHTFSGVNGQIIGFDYKAVSDGTLTVRVRDKNDNLVTVDTLELKAGETGSRNVDVPASVIGGSKDVQWEYAGHAVALDNLSVAEDRAGWYSAGNLMLPDYFNDIFREKFSNFVMALAARYKHNPTITAITVGGYGVYSELGLPGSLEQWNAYGYSAERYIEHVEWCASLYKKAFGDSKILILHTYTEICPTDPYYISYKITNYAVDNGLAIKTNSLQAKMTEWTGQGGVGWAYTANRFKHRDDVLIFHETAAQSANAATPYMGHPLSMLNRAIIDGEDYYWLYWSDLYQKYGAKYVHYANEAVGSAVMTNLYIRFGYYEYTNDNGQKTHAFQNVFNGLYLREKDYTVMEYKDGIQAVSSMDNLEPVEISVDDRQKYNSMYGTVITVHYYDEGESSFEVKVQEEEPGKNTGEDRVVGTVQLTGSNTWKSASFYTTAWGRSQRNHGEDMRKEIILNNIGDDMVYYAGVDVDYVPSREWKEQVLKASGETQKERELNGSVARVTLEKGQRASSLVIPVRTVNETGESDLIMRVKAVLPDGSQQAVTAKEYYMASEKHDEVILPVSEAPGNTVGFVVEMETLSGKQAVFTDKTGEPAVEVRGYTEKAASESRAYGDGIHEAMEPFSGIRVDKSQEGRPFVLYRWMDGEYRAIEQGSVYGGEVNTEPQTAGLYRLEIEGKGVCGRVKGLERLEASNEATGYCLGTELAAGFETDGEAMWTPVWNLKAIEKGEEGGLTARLSGAEPRYWKARSCR